MPEKWVLLQAKALPLRAKVVKSQARIREWYEHWDGEVCVSFSGGKDSTVLAHLVHDLFPDVPLVFANTGLEFPEIQAFAKQMGAEFVRPKMSFSEVISKYGYPIVSKQIAEVIYKARMNRPGKWDDKAKAELTWADWRRKALMGEDEFGGPSLYNKSKWLPMCQQTNFRISHMCCDVMKKGPIKKHYRETGRKPYLGTLTEESKLREQAWLKNGCNAFDSNDPKSQPLSFWTEQDILHYIYEEGIEIASVYGDIVAVDKNGYEYEPSLMCCDKLKCTGCQRTGCVFCGFGVHLEKGETRFQRLARTHPRQYEYCMGGGQWVDNPTYDATLPEYDKDWKNWNPRRIWVPSKEGLGMKHVFDECNELYGKDFIRYE